MSTTQAIDHLLKPKHPILKSASSKLSGFSDQLRGDMPQPPPPSPFVATTVATTVAPVDLPADFLASLLHQPKTVLSAGLILKDEPQVLAGIVPLPTASDANLINDAPRAVNVFVKVYLWQGWWRSLRELVAAPRAVRAWRAARRLLAAKVDTPEIWTVCRGRRWKIFPWRTVLVGEVVPDAIPEAGFWLENLRREEPRLILLSSMASALAAVHAAGVAHGDAKLSNFFFRRWRKNDTFCGLWDLDGSCVQRHLSPRLRVQDCARAAAAIVEKCLAMSGIEDVAVRVPDEFHRIYTQAAGQAQAIDLIAYQSRIVRILRKKGLPQIN